MTNKELSQMIVSNNKDISEMKGDIKVLIFEVGEYNKNMKTWEKRIWGGLVAIALSCVGWFKH